MVFGDFLFSLLFFAILSLFSPTQSASRSLLWPSTPTLIYTVLRFCNAFCFCSSSALVIHVVSSIFFCITQTLYMSLICITVFAFLYCLHANRKYPLETSPLQFFLLLLLNNCIQIFLGCHRNSLLFVDKGSVQKEKP